MKGFFKGFLSAVLSLGLLAQYIPAVSHADGLSGKLGDQIEWEKAYNYVYLYGVGDIPTLEELGIEKYPWDDDGFTGAVQINYGITGIPSGAFSGISQFELPASIEYIGSGAITDISSISMTVRSSDCVFEEGAISFTDDVPAGYIECYAGSTAEEYLNSLNGVNFISLGDKAHGNYTDGTLDYILYDDCAYVADLDALVTSVVIPEEVEGLPVTGIGSNAFREHPVSSAVMPDSITEICYGAFRSCDIKDIDLPDSLVSIGDEAFAWCSRLSEVRLPDSLQTIGSSAFFYCDDMYVPYFGSSLQSIGNAAFKYCSSIEYANLPESLTYMGESAFEESGLTRITIPSGIEVIEPYTFSNCTSLETVTLPDNIKKIYSNAFLNVPAFETMVISDETIVGMSELEVSGKSTENAVIPDNITSAYSNSYYGFGTLTIGSCLREFIAADAKPIEYDNKDILKDVYISEDNPYLCAEDGVVYNKDKTAIIYVAAEHEFENGIMTIPASVTEIRCSIINQKITGFAAEEGNTAFSVVDGILMDAEQKTILQYPAGRTDTSFNVPDGVETIADYSFYGADLKYVLIPASVKSVGKGAFWQTEPEYIVFQHTAEDILELDDEFEGFYQITLFGEYQYYHAQTDYYVRKGSVPDVKWQTNSIYLDEPVTGTHGNFTWSIEDLVLTVSGSGDMPKSSSGVYPWMKYPFTEVVFEGDNIRVADRAFEGYELLRKVSLSDVTSIGLRAFNGCSSLSEFTEHDKITFAEYLAVTGTLWASVPQDETGMNLLGNVLMSYGGTSGDAEIPDNAVYVSAGAFSDAEFNTLYVPESGITYSSLAFTGNDSLQRLRLIGSDTDLTAADFTKAAEKCQELILTDTSGNEVTGLCYTADNSIMSLAESLFDTPCMENMTYDYCVNILSAADKGFTDQQLITLLYNHTMRNTSYGFTYAESENGSLTGGGKKWVKSQHLSHNADGLVLLGRGVCSSFTEIVDAYIDAAENMGFTDTLRAVRCIGDNHEWNAVGLDAGTEDERWYYMDLSNRTYLIGYENEMLSQNPEMFSYDPELVKNDDSTYTVTLGDGVSVNIESEDMLLPDTRGDVNGDLAADLDDASAILTIYACNGAGLDSGFSDEQLTAADVNEDGEITLDDASAVLSYYARKGAGLGAEWDEII